MGQADGLRFLQRDTFNSRAGRIVLRPNLFHGTGVDGERYVEAAEQRAPPG